MIQPSSLELNANHPLSLLNQDLLMSDLKQEVAPKFFSKSCVFINHQDLTCMKNIIALTQKIFNQLKSSAVTTHGLFCGHDFHLTPAGPKLIEINTNSGGALLNYHLLKAQVITDASMQPAFAYTDLENLLVNQFKQEWELSQMSHVSDDDLKTICILDDHPDQQFLYLEFLLFQKLLTNKLAKTFIADPKEITLGKNGLYLQTTDGKVKIDFIYNRLTDFYFTEEKHSHINQAYQRKLCAFSPAPHHHALYANKAIFEQFCDANYLKNFHLNPGELSLMQTGIPRTSLVNVVNAEELWLKRKKLFFKPTMGYGSKGVYRGDKITHKVFDEIIQQKYIAQEFVPPGLRLIEFEGQKINLKYDIRIYSYAGEAFLAAARLYEGQATNFRTPGGGFAAVILI